MTWKQAVVEVESDEITWFTSRLQQQTSKETFGCYMMLFNKIAPPPDCHLTPVQRCSSFDLSSRKQFWWRICWHHLRNSGKNAFFVIKSDLAPHLAELLCWQVSVSSNLTYQPCRKIHSFPKCYPLFLNTWTTWIHGLILWNFLTWLVFSKIRHVTSNKYLICSIDTKTKQKLVQTPAKLTALGCL